MKPVSCQTYVNPQRQLLVTRSNKPFQLIHEWFIKLLSWPHVFASRPYSIHSLVFVLIYSKVKTAFFALQCRCNVYNFKQNKYNMFTWFPKIVLRKVCVCVCMYVCMHVCMYIFVFPHPREQIFYLMLESSLYTNTKAKQSLYYTHAQVSSPSKACFSPNRKLGVETICSI